MALVKVLTSGPVVNVPVSEFKPDTLGPLLAGNTEAIITKNKETLGIYMTVEQRNRLADEIETVKLLVDMMAAGKTWEDVLRSADQAATGRTMSIAEARRRAKERKEQVAAERAPEPVSSKAAAPRRRAKEKGVAASSR